MIGAIINCFVAYAVYHFVFEISLVLISRMLNSVVWVNVGQRFVLITGSTDGIGKAIALKLAQKGKKLLLLGRNSEKLEAVRKEALVHLKKEEYVITAQYDFSTEQDFSNLPDVPIGMLINNAGLSSEHPEFIEEESNAIKMININNINLVKLTQNIIPKMAQDSYIINIGSGLASMETPLLAAYSATKAYVKHFSHSIYFELAHKKIFCQYVAPNLVSTKMTKVRSSFFTPTAETFADAFVKTIGSHYRISPYLPHTLQNIVLGLLPSNFIGTFFYGRNLKIRTKAIAKKLKEQ
ncbi:17 beta-hydroxysteroid dehydrogenase type 3 [Pseudoloma neurophilia]|uniref:17 beta-hydroxysteroid dehydrogenase type 3 n=1 Tax=Pseudoloma neurophilia TaxID=146866 RepID=A0A0R0M4U0_9MICR|nr:17 beta-hydroxysteroid dehydrogenase type 3 [Pseudoloma neurophilia]